VWAVERRENQLEDHSVVDQAKVGPPRSGSRLLPRLPYRPEHRDHFGGVADASVPLAREWGMKKAVEDLRLVVSKAQKRDRPA
jgi:hypothetical protein